MNALDVKIFYLINYLPHPVWLDSLAIAGHALTRTGIIYGLFFVLLILLGKKRERVAVLLGATSIVVTSIVTDVILKHLVMRPRPFTVLPDVISVATESVHSFSFPSGQTAVAATLAYVVWHFFPRWYERGAAILLGIIVAFDRVYMGHHYPSDVCAGALLGIGVAACTIFFWKKIFARDAISLPDN